MVGTGGEWEELEFHMSSSNFTSICEMGSFMFFPRESPEDQRDK